MGTSESCRKSWITRRRRYGLLGIKSSTMQPKFFKGHNWGHCRKCGKLHVRSTTGSFNKGQISWNKGKTKETDPRIYSSWNKGLTKETDERVARVALKKVGRKRPPVLEETRKKLSDRRKGYIMPESTCKKLSDARKRLVASGWVMPEHARTLISKKNKASFYSKSPEEQEQMRENGRRAFLGKTVSDEHKDKLRVATERQWIRMRDQMILSLQTARNVRPNKFESDFLEMCMDNKINEVRYVGNGTFWITVPKEFRDVKSAINPDYVIEPFSKTRAVIETIGLHWHDDVGTAARKSIYEKLGIKYLFVTDKRFNENFLDIVDEVKDFVRVVIS